jgi:negative regulator of sigma E activity
MSIPRSFVAICLFLVVAPSEVIAETPSPTTILAKMADANRTLDYSGIFTYEHGGILRFFTL